MCAAKKTGPMSKSAQKRGATASGEETSKKGKKRAVSAKAKQANGGARGRKKTRTTEGNGPTENNSPVFGPKTDIQELPKELVPIAVAEFTRKMLDEKAAQPKRERRTLGEPYKLANYQKRELAARNQAARNSNERLDYSNVAGNKHFLSFTGHATMLAAHEPWLLEQLQLAYDEQLQGATSPRTDVTRRVGPGREQDQVADDPTLQEDPEVQQAVQQLPPDSGPDDSSRVEGTTSTPVGGQSDLFGNTELVRRNAELQEELSRLQTKLDSEQTCRRDLKRKEDSLEKLKEALELKKTDLEEREKKLESLKQELTKKKHSIDEDARAVNDAKAILEREHLDLDRKPKTLCPTLQHQLACQTRALQKKMEANGLTIGMKKLKEQKDVVDDRLKCAELELNDAKRDSDQMKETITRLELENERLLLHKRIFVGSSVTEGMIRGFRDRHAIPEVDGCLDAMHEMQKFINKKDTKVFGEFSRVGRGLKDAMSEFWRERCNLAHGATGTMIETMDHQRYLAAISQIETVLPALESGMACQHTASQGDLQNF